MIANLLLQYFHGSSLLAPSHLKITVLLFLTIDKIGYLCQDFENVLFLCSVFHRWKTFPQLTLRSGTIILVPVTIQCSFVKRPSRISWNFSRSFFNDYEMILNIFIFYHFTELMSSTPVSISIDRSIPVGGGSHNTLGV